MPKKKAKASRKRPVGKTTKKRTTHAIRTKKSASKFEGLTDLLSRIEVEAEKIVKRVVERAEEASIDLRQSIEDLVDQVRANGIYSIANDKKDDLEREIRRLAEEVVERARDVELLPFNASNRDRIIREARKNLEELRDRISGAEWLARARISANNTKDLVLNVLSIPSQGEVIKLQRKISSLEKRVNNLNRKAA